MKPAPITITLSANTSWYLYNFRASTIRALVAEGYRVVCVSPPDKYSLRLADLGAEWRVVLMDNAGTNLLRDLKLVRKFWQVYRDLRPRVAFHFTIKNNVYGTWAARACGVTAVNNVSGLGTAFIRQGLVPTVVRALYRLSQPLAHRVFCQNEEDFALLRDRRLVPAERLALLPGSGVDLRRFSPCPRGREPNRPLRLLYAGRMLADKGLHELIAAMRQVNAGGIRCELLLCGFAGAANVSAITEATLLEWSREPGVCWLGPSDDMPGVYAQADAVVLPSYREGMPRSLLEAGAMGLPVVATDVPGCRNIVTDGVNGWLCEARSVTSLRAAIEKLLAMPHAARVRMGMAGRTRVEAEFDERQVVEAALAVVREIAH
ncbi:MAG: glycosyltransferase family 4 protein [Diaphorobacter sp.]|jgi:glycosyltransferase involved in cell wall biosynthesis|nr:glycosyltransferase family 4 protein [Diaphorobacter sp.]